MRVFKLISGFSLNRRQLSRLPMLARVLLWVIGVPAVLIVALYLRLLVGPMEVPFVREQAEAFVRSALADDAELQLGKVELAVDSYLRPVLQFEPVTYTDPQSGASAEMDMLVVRFSPLFTLIGKPGLTITMVHPRLQLIQDLLGPRLGRFEVVDDGEDGNAVVHVYEGENQYPTVGILAEGLSVRGNPPTGDGIGLRSDNDWLILNVASAEKSLTDLIAQAQEGRFAQLVIRDAEVEMLDPVYGLIRKFSEADLTVTPGFGGKSTTGTVSATLAGRRMSGSFSRMLDADGAPILNASMQNLDFAAFLPFLDDPDALAAVRGGGKFDSTFRFSANGADIVSGIMNVDLTGTQLRLRNDLFPIERGAFSLNWDPVAARFSMEEALLAVGNSSAFVKGDFVMGLDDTYGPIVAMSITARAALLNPDDLPVSHDPFDEIFISGWSSGLYGALGIDQMVARKAGAEIRAKGRIDMVRRGMGVDLELGGEGASADDLKRLWPYVLAQSNRDWFVQHVTGGRLESADMHFRFPVGTLDVTGMNTQWPENSLSIDLVGNDVSFIPIDGMRPLLVNGHTKLKVRDSLLSVALGDTLVDTEKGPVSFGDLAIIMDFEQPYESVLEVSGGISTDLPALIALAEAQAPELLDTLNMPVSSNALSGRVEGDLVATLVFDQDGAITSTDYAANGTVSGFASAEPVAGRRLTDGDFTFNTTTEGYHIAGAATVDGLRTELILDGALDAQSDLKIASTIDAAEFAKLGFDASEFITGNVTFVGKPMDDGAMQIAVDLGDAELTVKDLGLRKARGVPGTLNVQFRQDGTRIDIPRIELTFEQIHMAGTITLDSEAGLIGAEFSELALGEGDSATLSVVPGENGYVLTLRGAQLDLKPMLRRYFALDQTSTGAPQATAVKQTITIDAKLDRALGFYSTTAYNFDLKLSLRGEDISSASLQAQFTEGNSISITTNPSATGHVMSVAANDVGTVLRFLNVYPRLLGGEGSLVMRTNTTNHVDRGEIRLKNFSIVDEKRVAEVLGNHEDSRKLIARENRVNFSDAQVSFLRRPDRIQVTDAVLDGGSIGGTLRGFVYTKERRYDLTGTYIPLFGLNNIFQKLPLIGNIVGGREGEGLVGVTYALRGSLDNPKFVVNPVSILAPGVFRSLFEFRAKEAPRQDEQAGGQGQ